MVSTVITFAIPRRKDLRCMVCKIINPGNNPRILEYSSYCRNKLKYREFLDEIPEAMAAPIDFQDGFIYVIVANDLFENRAFRHYCRNALDIKIMQKDHPIFDDIYERCLLHTIEHKLLGQWNKVGQYLAKGPDFFNLTRSVNAIELKIHIRGNNAQLYMQAFNFQIPFLQEALKDRDFQPDEVYVLPRLSRVDVIRSWKVIQRERSDLREYWRKMHGYTLPVNEKGLLFYEVEFFPGSTMVYNELCLTSSQDLTPFPLTNDMATKIYKNFIEDLREKVTTLCGQELVYPEVQEV